MKARPGHPTPAPTVNCYQTKYTAMTDVPPLPGSHQGGTGHRSLMHAVRAQAARLPAKTALIHLADGETEAGRISCAELDQRARALAAALQARGAAGQRMLLPLPSGIDHAVAFLGCVYAQAVPVPLFPPGSSAHAARVDRIAADCGAQWALAAADSLPLLSDRMRRAGVAIDASRWIPIDAHGGDAAQWTEPDIAPTDLAFLQYTSGSTGDPRGVMVQHAQLLHHFRLQRDSLAHHEDDVFVSWLPLFHDMGLVGQLLQSLMLGATLVLMPPSAFLQRPLRWLEALSRYRGTLGYAPNFAYALCTAAARTAAAGSVARLDLSAWRIAINAAEPVHAETLQAFAQAFAPAGLRRESLVAAYGLAEATLQVTATHRAGRQAVEPLRASAAALQDGRLRAAGAGEASRWIVPVGVAQEPADLAIVAPESRRRCADGEVGEVWLRGGAVAAGYWQRPDATAHTFGAHLANGQGPWLRTGDLGAMLGGTLHIVGRLKDLIVVRGQNHHPGDIEHSVQASHAALGRTAAFAVDEAGEERVVVVAELQRTERHRFDGPAVLGAVRAALLDGHGLGLHALWLLKPGTLPLTSSGKVRRAECRRLFLDATLPALFAWREDSTPAAPGGLGQAERVAHGATDGAADGAAGRSAESPAELALLLQADPPLALQRLQGVLFDCTAQALKWDAARCDELRPGFGVQALNMIGLDSLSAMDLSHQLQQRLHVEVLLEDLLAGTTAQQVTQRLAALLATQQSLQRLTAPAAPTDGEPADRETWVL